MAAVTTVILSLKGLVVKDARPLSVFVETVNMDVVQTELHQQQVSCQSLSSMGDASGVHLSSVPSALPPAAHTFAQVPRIYALLPLAMSPMLSALPHHFPTLQKSWLRPCFLLLIGSEITKIYLSFTLSIS